VLDWTFALDHLLGWGTPRWLRPSWTTRPSPHLARR